MGSARKPLQALAPKTYAFFIGRLDDTAHAQHLDMEEMRLNRLKRSLYLFNEGTREQLTSEGNRLYADKVNGKGRYYPIFFTLTYDIKKHPDYALYAQLSALGIDATPPSRHSIWHTRHITNFIDAYRKHWERELKQPRSTFRYVWVAELQQDGVLHYHAVMYCPRGKSLPKADNYWQWGRTKTEAVRGGVNGYLMKYLSKGSVKADTLSGQPARYFPKGARIFGMGGLSSAEQEKMRYVKLPSYVKDVFKQADGCIERCYEGWKQGKVELVSPWSYHKSQDMAEDQKKDLFNNLDADKVQADIAGKTYDNFSFGLLEYNQTVWLLKDKAKYEAELKEAKDIYNRCYDSATRIPCAYSDLPDLAKRLLKMSEETYELERMKQIAQVIAHTTNIKIGVIPND